MVTMLNLTVTHREFQNDLSANSDWYVFSEKCPLNVKPSTRESSTGYTLNIHTSKKAGISSKYGINFDFGRIVPSHFFPKPAVRRRIIFFPFPLLNNPCLRTLQASSCNAFIYKLQMLYLSGKPHHPAWFLRQIHF